MVLDLLRRLYNLNKETCKKKTENPIKIGILGAANIAPAAVIWPAGKMEDVVIYAVAARNQEKAAKFAKKYKIPHVYGSYQELLNDPNIDAIYNPSPNGLHAYWTAKALEKGLHVLCEKPLTSNEEEAKELVNLAKSTQAKDNRVDGIVLLEAFHYRFHPLALRMREIIDQGLLGKIKHVSTRFLIPIFSIPKSDIRYNMKGTNPELAGGAMMDAGCYAINCMRLLKNDEPVQVTSAKVQEAFPEVDEVALAEFKFADGSTGKIEASFRNMGFSASAMAQGERATMHVTNFLAPFVYHRMKVVDNATGKILLSEKHYENGASTYEYQLRAFVGAIRGDQASIELCKFAGDPEDSIKNMHVIDSVYLKAGLHPRIGKAI